ncbi:hypothetical protein FSP39_016658 [Pinctada imbricata]|uniref:TIR domain-containing protein n=1 Tax=Pinctada imbricata TaxID=66713 RepID=A0AA88YJN9_PINIB|nr:hypothetical protein FSP39_016658 [Pinctada imbricata]
MNPEFISHLSSITNLSIAQCNIGHNAKAFPIIYNLTNLTSLDIAENLIDDLNPIFFQSQVLSLKNLSLADNNLRAIPKAVFVLQNLKYLDLRLNLLSGISSDEMSFIDGLDDLIIFLGGNALRCSCETLPFMNWVRDNYNKIKDYNILTCKYNNVSEIKLEMAIRQLHQMEINCVSNIWLGLSISGLICLLLIVMVVFLLYKFQPDVRYVIARVKRFLRKMNRKASNVPILNHKQYHAYVSYGDTNYKWACKVLYKALKDEGFHLSLQHKDFEAGIPLSENILDAIDSSRRVIFVLSHDFLENEWDDFKIQIATYHAIRKRRKISLSLYFWTLFNYMRYQNLYNEFGSESNVLDGLNVTNKTQYCPSGKN